MKKKILSLLLVLLLILTMVFPAAAEELGVSHVDPDTIYNSMDVISDAIYGMDDVFDDSQASDISDIFSGFADAFSLVSPLVGPINGGITFLKLIGLIKDKTTQSLAGITNQLHIIGEQLSDMDRKLNELTVQMSEMKASIEFDARAEKASILQTSWKSFEFRYMEDGLDSVITDYNGKVRDGLQYWCTNENSRASNGVDNSQIVLLYTLNDSGYNLKYTSENGIPSDITSDTRYLILGKDILPGHISWNINTYRTAIKNKIIEKIKEILSSDTDYSFEYANFPEFSGEAEITDSFLEKIADDAVNVLVYRVASAELNKDSSLALNVEMRFLNYCTHLLSAGEGIDAMCKTMYLTHAFEYEIADDMTDFLNQMAFKTGVYGSFALNILGMSDSITDEEKLTTLDTYCRTLLTIDDYKSTCLTGYDTYCYITNTPLAFGDVTFSTALDVETKTRGAVTGYEGYSSSPIDVEATYANEKTLLKPESLIGDSNMLLLQYLLRSNGIQDDFDYFNERIGNGSSKNYNSIIVSMSGEETMPLSKDSPLLVTNLLGSYFKDKSTAKLNSLPKDSNTDYLLRRNMISGSVVDTASGQLVAEQPLSCIVFYGESHWYWQTDESAILGGPSDQNSFAHTHEKELINVDLITQKHYKHHYTQSISYNCLIKVPAEQLFSGSSVNILASYISLCDELREEFGSSDVTLSDSKPSPGQDSLGSSNDTALKNNTEVSNTQHNVHLWPFILSACIVLCIIIVVMISRRKKKN